MELRGQKTLLEEVAVEDAKEICDLRNDSNINRYLSSSVKITVEEQEQWILRNKQKNDGYYFKIIDLSANEMCGTIALYNVCDGGAEFGRYIATKSLQALEAELLILRCAFDVMGLKRVYCRTAIENSKVWRQHYRFGFQDEGEEWLVEKGLVLKKQAITIEQFQGADFSFLNNLLIKFA